MRAGRQLGSRLGQRLLAVLTSSSVGGRLLFKQVVVVLVDGVQAARGDREGWAWHGERSACWVLKGAAPCVAGVALRTARTFLPPACLNAAGAESRRRACGTLPHLRAKFQS